MISLSVDRFRNEAMACSKGVVKTFPTMSSPHEAMVCEVLARISPSRSPSTLMASEPSLGGGVSFCARVLGLTKKTNPGVGGLKRRAGGSIEKKL